jgi:hypothetical protein
MYNSFTKTVLNKEVQNVFPFCYVSRLYVIAHRGRGCSQYLIDGVNCQTASTHSLITYVHNLTSVIIKASVARGFACAQDDAELVSPCSSQRHLPNSFNIRGTQKERKEGSGKGMMTVWSNKRK